MSQVKEIIVKQATNKSKKRRGRKTKVAKSKKERKKHVPFTKKALTSKGYVSQVPQQSKLDPRFTANTKTLTDHNIISNINPAIVIDAVNSDTVFCGVPLAIVSYALTRGWQNFESPDYPFMAFVYACQLIFNARANVVPQAVSIPRWMEIYISMITPKHCKFLGGKLQNRWIISQTDASTIAAPTMSVGPIVYGAKWNCGTITTNTVNGIFKTIDVTNTYNADTGVKAWASLLQFLSTLDETKDLGKMHAIKSFVLDRRYENDVSAFATCLAKPGGGFASTGGYVTILNSEVPIYRPVFSCHADNSNGNYEPGRYPNFMHKFAGDTVFLGGCLASILGEDQLKVKRAPTFQCIDINEFGDVLCQAMTQAVTLAIKDSQVQTAITQIGLSGVGLTCPLTVQEVMLMLRANLMQAFSDSQYAVQGIYPRATTGNSDNQFVALVSGFGTCALSGTTGMLLPLALAENIRSLTWRQNTGARGGHENPALYIPILGVYANDVLNEADYVVNYTPVDSPPVSVPVFTPANSLSTEVIDKKGKKTFLAPEIISLVDGKAATDFVAINDPAAISQLTTVWNKWINSISSFLQTLVPIGTDAGINSMAMITQTTMWTPIQTGDMKKKEKLTRFLPTTIGESSIYDQRQITGYLFSVAPFKSCWDQVQASFVAPVLQQVTVADNSRDTTFQTMSAALNEPLQMSIIESENPMSLGLKHVTLASYMVKARNASTTELDNFFVNEAKHGRGGILGGIASQLFSNLAPLGVNMIASGLNKIPY